MRFISLFFSILPLCAMGQGFGFSDHVYLSPVPRVPITPSPTNPPFLQSVLYRWRASDLSNSPVDFWSDEIHNVTATNIGGGRPTLTSFGVTFDGVTNILYFTNFSPTWTGSTSPVLVVLRPLDNSQRVIVGGGGGGNRLFNVASGKWSLGSPMNTMYPGHMVDFLSLGIVAGNFQCYTNGVLHFSGGGITGLEPAPFMTFGGRFGTSSEYFNGEIEEIIVWTNLFAFTNTSVGQSVSNVHWYCTNWYGTNILGPTGIYP